PDAEVIGENLLEVLARKTGVPRLHWTQEALLGGQQRAAAVQLDRAALEHDAPVPPVFGRDGEPEGPPQPSGDAPGHGGVTPVVRVLRPPREAPAHESEVAIRATQEERTVIARPRAIRGNAKPVDATGIDAGAPEHRVRLPLKLLVSYQDPHALAGDEMADDL